jgi:hypothetical protein
MCMCGDTHCWSCGPAQGNNKCHACGIWDDDGGGCQTPVECDLKLAKQDAEFAELERRADERECPWCPHSRHASTCSEAANGCVCQGTDENV